jgi:hypothetical protein
MAGSIKFRKVSFCVYYLNEPCRLEGVWFGYKPFYYLTLCIKVIKQIFTGFLVYSFFYLISRFEQDVLKLKEALNKKN